MSSRKFENVEQKIKYLSPKWEREFDISKETFCKPELLNSSNIREIAKILAVDDSCDTAKKIFYRISLLKARMSKKERFNCEIPESQNNPKNLPVRVEINFCPFCGKNLPNARIVNGH